MHDIDEKATDLSPSVLTKLTDGLRSLKSVFVLHVEVANIKLILYFD